MVAWYDFNRELITKAWIDDVTKARDKRLDDLLSTTAGGAAFGYAASKVNFASAGSGWLGIASGIVLGTTPLLNDYITLYVRRHKEYKLLEEKFYSEYERVCKTPYSRIEPYSAPVGNASDIDSAPLAEETEESDEGDANADVRSFSLTLYSLTTPQRPGYNCWTVTTVKLGDPKFGGLPLCDNFNKNYLTETCILKNERGEANRQLRWFSGFLRQGLKRPATSSFSPEDKRMYGQNMNFMVSLLSQSLKKSTACDP